MLASENEQKILEKCIRKSNVAARVGGDEFACVIPEVESKTSVEKVINRILESVPVDAEKLSHKKNSVFPLVD